LVFICIGEVLAYIILGKIENFALKDKYCDEFLEYLKRNKIEKKDRALGIR